MFGHPHVCIAYIYIYPVIPEHTHKYKGTGTDNAKKYDLVRCSCVNEVGQEWKQNGCTQFQTRFNTEKSFQNTLIVSLRLKMQITRHSQSDMLFFFAKAKSSTHFVLSQRSAGKPRKQFCSSLIHPTHKHTQTNTPIHIYALTTHTQRHLDRSHPDFGRTN